MPPPESQAVDPRRIDADVTGCAAEHQRLLAHLTGEDGDALTDEVARRPSLLPGWTVGHVLSHIARNADGVARMVEGASRGEVADQYPGGVEERAADIEAGAGRRAAELIDDVRHTIYRLEAAFASCTAHGWAGSGTGLLVTHIPVAQMPRRRRREVAIHHADLGLGFGFADWDPAFLRAELTHQTQIWQSRRPMGMTDLPPAALALAEPDRLAWLVGRLHVPGLDDPQQMM